MDASKVLAEINAEYERRDLVKKIESKDWRVRIPALRNYYATALSNETKYVPPHEWGVDPYEVNWSAVFTPIEKWLWRDIRAVGAVFYPQFPVLDFIVDFANPEAKVAIECDGSAYHKDKEKDAKRDSLLSSMGWSVYRITGKECFTDLNEETMERGYARDFIESISATHGLARKNYGL